MNSDAAVMPQFGEGLSCWLTEVGYQHANNTYLTLFGAQEKNDPPLVPDLMPQLTGLQPPTGLVAGGNIVTISGSNFTRNTQVDFGVVAADTTYVSPTQLTAKAPPGAGVVPVTVTSEYGTSPITATAGCTDPAPPKPGPYCTYTYQFGD